MVAAESFVWPLESSGPPKSGDVASGDETCDATRLGASCSLGGEPKALAVFVALRIAAPTTLAGECDRWLLGPEDPSPEPREADEGERGRLVEPPDVGKSSPGEVCVGGVVSLADATVDDEPGPEPSTVGSAVPPCSLRFFSSSLCLRCRSSSSRSDNLIASITMSSSRS